MRSRKANVDTIPTEAEEMRIVSKYLDFLGLVWCHVPNEQRHRRHGVKSGVPDILIFDRPPSYPYSLAGMAIELKRSRCARVSEQQRRWHEALGELGWLVRVCFGSDEAIGAINYAGYAKANKIHDRVSRKGGKEACRAAGP